MNGNVPRPVPGLLTRKQLKKEISNKTIEQIVLVNYRPPSSESSESSSSNSNSRCNAMKHTDPEDVAAQAEWRSLHEEFKDVFPEELPPGLPPSS